MIPFTPRRLSRSFPTVRFTPTLFALSLASTIPFAGLAAPSAYAQSATTGAIIGTVADPNGALLPATTILVKSVDTGAPRTVKTNGAGEFRVSELEPGTYIVTINADGFAPYSEENVVVTVGGLSTIAAKLKVGGSAQTVEVLDQPSTLNTDTQGISTTLDQAAIDNLPINGRRWSDFALLTPGVVSNSDGFGLLSFRGISYLLNNNTVDGADDNQAYFSEARGRTRLSYAITQVAVQEFQVNTSNYSAQYGRAAGGVINTVTKSGTNHVHGEAFFYDRDNDLGGAINPYTLLNVPNGTGGFNQQPFKPTDWRKQWGFGVGGPIIRDKVFFFYAYDQSRRNFPLVARTTDPNDLFAPSNSTLPAGETCSTTAFTATSLTNYTEGDYNACAISALYKLNSFQAGSAYYQQGLGIINSFIGQVPRTADQVINLPKLDWQINDRNRLSLFYNRLRYSSPNGYYSQATVTDGNDDQGNDFVKEDFGIARMTSLLTNNIVNEGLVQYGRDFEYTLADTPSPNDLPLANNVNHVAPQVQIGYNEGGGIYVGANSGLNRYALPDERRLQLLDGVTWSHGKHVTKAGLEYNKVSDYINSLSNGFGSYSYDYGYTYIADYLNAFEGVGGAAYKANQLYYSYGQTFGNPKGLITTREYAGYLTDDYRITPNLTLTLGLRYEYEYIPPSPYPNPVLTAAIPAAGKKPDDRNNIGPRFGFAWNAFGNGRTYLRGGYGLYYGRVINSDILQTDLQSGGPNGQISSGSLYIGGNCTAAPTFPNILPSIPTTSGCIATSNVAYLDPHTQNPQVSETDLSIEQDLGHHTSLSLTYMASFGHELPDSIDVNYNSVGTYNYTFTAGAAPTTASGVVTSYPISGSAEATFSKYPQPPQAGYVTLPHGGMKAPLTAGQAFTTKVFLQPIGTTQTRPFPAFGTILDVRSDVNSNYNAMAVQVNHRFERGFSLLANYTWSHAIDENPYIGTGVATYNIYDPTNRRLEYGNSSTNVPNRGVIAMVYQPQTHFHGYKDYLLGGWRVAPLYQVQNGLPFTPTVTGSVTGLTVPNGVDGCTPSAYATGTSACTATPAYKGLNGSGSTANRLPVIERNTYKLPSTSVVDLRLAKNFYLHAPHLEGARFELLAEVFNVLNHQNITGVQQNAYTLSGQTLTPNVQANQFGTNTNSDSNYTYSQRQVQIAARLHF